MATVAINSVQQRTSHFYLWMAVACALVAFGGFAPTYWLQVPAGTFVGPPLLHIHAALFSGWTLLLVWQAYLVESGRVERHRATGLAGIGLATAMVIVGFATAIYSVRTGLAAGFGDSVREFFIVPVSALVLFAGFFVAAISNIRRPEWHKRLILMATISLLPAAVARWFFVLATGGGPGMRPGLGQPLPVSFAAAPGLLVELLIVAGMVYDWRTRGRPHPIWLYGAAITTAVIVIRGPISASAGWLSFADAMTRLAG
jgi:hypothetical protein